jgi:hypothetical protein
MARKSCSDQGYTLANEQSEAGEVTMRNVDSMEFALFAATPP